MINPNNRRENILVEKFGDAYIRINEFFELENPTPEQRDEFYTWLDTLENR